MKQTLLTIILASYFYSTNVYSQTNTTQQVQVSIDLNTVKDDKVTVTVIPPKFTCNEVIYHFPKIIPGTYSEDDFGKYIENFKAYTKKGEPAAVVRLDKNSWTIKNVNEVTKITYQVNDTFDIENTHEIFSPAGTNIDAGKNYIINTHAFIGYFSDIEDLNYKLTVLHPESLWGATSLTDEDSSKTVDVFFTSRYAELVENPIMYSKPDYSAFYISGMDILIAVYSPNGIHTAASITTEMTKMMTAQKKFLGKFNSTKKYSVLIYFSDVDKENDAHGFGALEHPTATTVVMPEAISNEQLAKELKDVVSHEFFHIVTPLTIHSKEIQYFDYNNPKMSEHLWLYEGVTEYFANLFQINQGLVSEDEFYDRMSKKIENASKMNDTISFTKMSANILVQPYKDQYLNVYEKGALIGMCLDIIIREKSNGKRGILDLMQKLSNEYGVHKSFNDKDLFAKITQLTYPEVGSFLTKHVSGETPIQYEYYLDKMGVSKNSEKVAGNAFLNGETPYVTVDQDTKEISVIPNIPLNDFLNELNIKGGDIILSINDVNYNLENIYEMITISESWKNDESITVKIKREGVEQIITGKIVLPYNDHDVYRATDASKDDLKDAWLKS